jgi:hypothetical protein
MYFDTILPSILTSSKWSLPFRFFRLIFCMHHLIVWATCAAHLILLVLIKVKGKVIPVTDHGGPQGCEMLRVPHYLDNRITDGGEVVSLTRRPPFTPQDDSWYSFLLEAESTPEL